MPSLNLTFIVLANTDNLTVPFNGIGNGDVSKSLPSLSFFKHFVFPKMHGYSLPQVDWQGTEQNLVEQLNGVEDEASKLFLERELWSYRQAFASAGRQELVDQLYRVSRQAYPMSKFRYDPLFTATSGKYPVVSPIMNAAAMVGLVRVTILWLSVVMLSAILIVILLARKKERAFQFWFIWVLAALLLGPIALVVYALVKWQTTDLPLPIWRQAAGASCFCLSGYGLAWFLAIALLLTIRGDPHPLVILGLTYLTPFLTGLLLIRTPFMLRQGIGGLRKALSRGFLVEMVTMNIGFSVLFPLTMLAQKQLVSVMPSPTSPYFWVTISTIVFVGALALFPLEYGMGRLGFTIWPDRRITGGAAAIILPTFRDSWWLLLVTLGIMIAVLAWTISQLG